MMTWPSGVSRYRRPSQVQRSGEQRSACPQRPARGSGSRTCASPGRRVSEKAISAAPPTSTTQTVSRQAKTTRGDSPRGSASLVATARMWSMRIPITVRKMPPNRWHKPDVTTTGLDRQRAEVSTWVRLAAGTRLEGRLMSPNGVRSLNDVRSPDASGWTEWADPEPETADRGKLDADPTGGIVPATSSVTLVARRASPRCRTDPIGWRRRRRRIRSGRPSRRRRRIRC